MNKPTVEEKQLIEARNDLKTEQSQINITENFAKHSRLQRKINGIDEKLNDLRSDRNNITVHFAITYGVKLFLGLLILISSLYFRNTPVFHIDERITLIPFDRIISYPNEKNTVSFHFWVLCCSSVARLIKI